MTVSWLGLERAVLSLLFITCLTWEVTPASPAHIHSHQINKERVDDGAYVRRDHQHNVDGQHRSEFDHESIIGSIKDAEEFDHLPPDEAKRRLAMLLQKMDLNRDAHISRQELKAWILRSFKMLSEEESKERFEDADENEDGTITWEEYKLDTFGSDEEDNLRHQDEETMLENDKLMFDVSDKNRDGVLDKAEFLTFSHPEEHPEMLPLILNHTLRQKDLNSDGYIDFQEFVGDRAKNHDKEWLISEKDRFDADYDRDHDGKLNSNEILSWIVPSNEEIAEEEVAHLFASTDDDQDNQLSFQEVLDNHETFVGSEATDYGEHLHNIHTFIDEL